MNFLKTIQDSIYSPKFYSQLIHKSFDSALGYFFALILIATLFQGLSTFGILLTDTESQVKQIVNEVITFYPQELEINIQGGQVSINAPEPYIIPLGTQLEEATKSNLLVIDTQTPFSTTQFNQYQTVAWLTKDSIIFKNQNSAEIKAYDLSQIKEFKIDRTLIQSWANMLSPWLKFIGPVIFIITLIGLFIFFSFRLLHLLILALIIWVLSKLFKKPLSYSKAYVVSIYAITLPIVVDLFLSLTSNWFHLKGFPFMFSLITIGVVIVNLFLQTDKYPAKD